MMAAIGATGVVLMSFLIRRSKSQVSNIILASSGKAGLAKKLSQEILISAAPMSKTLSLQYELRFYLVLTSISLG